MNLFNFVQSLFQRKWKLTTDMSQVAWEHGAQLGDSLRLQLRRDRPDLIMTFAISPGRYGHFMLDIHVDDDKGNLRLIVIEYSPSRDKAKLDPYGCSDCTDEEDCGYGSGCQFSYPNAAGVSIWFQRHIKWMMPQNEAA